MHPTPPQVPAPTSPPGWAPLGVDDGRTGATGPGGRDEEEGRRTWVVWLLVGVAIAAIVGIILLLTRNSSAGDEPTPVLVPDVVGMTEDAAREAIEGLDLEFQRLTEPSTVEVGLVTRTDPEADTEVDPDSAVQVWISSGPDAIVVPTMLNFTQDQAITALTDAGFDAANIRWLTEEHVTVLEGSVIRTEPPAGESVSPSAEIRVYTSTGMVTLPSLVSGTEQEARDALGELRLVPEVSYQDSADQTPGTVLSQNPSAGRVPQASTVQIVVAQAPVIEQVQVPDVTGRTYGQAAAQLGSASLHAQPGEERYSDTVQAGRVIETNPAAGALVDEGSTVTVILSLGPENPPEEDPGPPPVTP
jgi:serine/threonine-protein kinase